MITVEEKMDSTQICSFIGQIELFKSLAEEELLTVADYIEERQYKAGEYIFREFGPRKKLFMVYIFCRKLWSKKHPLT